MKTLYSTDKNFSNDFMDILNRASMDMQNIIPKVSGLIKEIRIEGNKAIFRHIERFDRWSPKEDIDIEISQKECKKAYDNLDKKMLETLYKAYERIYSFHSKQKPKSWIDFEDNGTILGQKVGSVERAGLYIPGGKAAYPSSLLMNAIPAIVAGVKEIVVCTPTPENSPNDLLLAAIYLCKLEKIYKVGGASAIGAMAYGTNTIPKVDVITGPGNIYVATAKKIVYGDVNIDMIAGPSEIGIIADENANEKYIAIDLLSQAEHDEMASSILVTHSKDLALKVSKCVDEELKSLKRAEIAKKSIEQRGVIIVTKSLEESIELMNKIAPEHLELLCDSNLEILPFIKNAGAIFIGENTPEAIGDYIAGPNHTLPTGGTARFFSPLSTEHFMKKSSIISFSKKAIKEVGEYCALIADSEGLDAHKKSVEYRL